MFFRKKKKPLLQQLNRAEGKNLARAFLSLEHRSSATYLALWSTSTVQNAIGDQTLVAISKMAIKYNQKIIDIKEWAEKRAGEDSTGRSLSEIEKDRNVLLEQSKNISQKNEFKKKERIDLYVEEHFSNTSEAYSCINLIEELILFLKLTPSPLGSIQEAAESSSRLLQQTNFLLSQQNPKYSGNTLDELSSFIIGMLIQEQFEDASDEKKDELVQKLDQFFKEMDSDKRSDLQQSLGLEEISEKTLRSFLIGGGAYALASSVIALGGFGVYAAATQFLSLTMGWLFSALGLGLAPYIFLTSGISIVFGSLLGPILLGGFFIKKGKNKNREIKERLLPIIVSLTYIEWKLRETIQSDNRIKQTTLEWNEAWNQYSDFCDQFDNAEAKKEKLQISVISVGEKIIKYKEEATSLGFCFKKNEENKTKALLKLNDNQLYEIGLDQALIVKAVTIRKEYIQNLSENTYKGLQRWAAESECKDVFKQINIKLNKTADVLKLPESLLELISDQSKIKARLKDIQRKKAECEKKKRLLKEGVRREKSIMISFRKQKSKISKKYKTFKDIV